METWTLNITVIAIICIITTTIFFYQVAGATNKSSYKFGFKIAVSDYYDASYVDADFPNSTDDVTAGL